MAEAYYSDQIVAGLAGVSRQTLKDWARKGRGPVRRRIGERRVGYLASEVDAWLANRPAVAIPKRTEAAPQSSIDQTARAVMPDRTEVAA
jgi:predicted DNA-binding transcriptional regulator AlpA